MAGRLHLVWALVLWPLSPLGGEPQLDTDDVPADAAEAATAPPEDTAIRRKPTAGIRPYSLSLAQEDYHYAPKPRHLRQARLLRMLGPSFDPFWMSVENPRNRSTDPPGELVSLSRDLADGAARYQKKLLHETEGLDLAGLLLPPGEAGGNLTRALGERLRAWLVERATCRLTSSWVDLGPVFWPRWVRHTDCDALGPPSCSWPPGMVCRRAQLTHIKLLAWHCWATVPDGGAPGRPLQQCAWRLIPYPVVAACKCSCR